jgi:Zn-finger nucleic acid-binding protein
MHPEPFERICAHNESQAAVLARPANELGTAQGLEKVRYLQCPECSKLMNRVNFAKYSGVIMDVCKEHGTFFDRDELRRIVTFIREGGLDMSRDREREKLVLEQQRLARMKLDLERERFAAQPVYHEPRHTRNALTELLSDLFGR